MEIVNVLSIKNGIPFSIVSFPIHEEQLQHEVVQQAETLFLNLVKLHLPEGEEFDEEFYLDEGSFDDMNGNEFYIIWSE